MKKIWLFITTIFCVALFNTDSAKAITIHNDNAGFISNFSSRVCFGNYCTVSDSVGITTVSIVIKGDKVLTVAIVNRTTYNNTVNNMAEITSIGGAPLFIVEDDQLESPYFENKQANPTYQASLNSYLNSVINGGNINIDTDLGKWIINQLKNEQLCGDLENNEVTKEDVKSCKKLFIDDHSQAIDEYTTKTFYMTELVDSPVKMFELKFTTSVDKGSYDVIASHPTDAELESDLCKKTDCDATNRSKYINEALKIIEPAIDDIMISSDEMPQSVRNAISKLSGIKGEVIKLLARIEYDDGLSTLSSYKAVKTMRVIFLRPSNYEKIPVAYVSDGKLIEDQKTDLELIKYLISKNKLRTTNTVLVVPSGIGIPNISGLKVVSTSLNFYDLEDADGNKVFNEAAAKAWLQSYGSGTKLADYIDDLLDAINAKCNSRNNYSSNCLSRLGSNVDYSIGDAKSLQTIRQKEIGNIQIPKLKAGALKNFISTIQFVALQSIIPTSFYGDVSGGELDFSLSSVNAKGSWTSYSNTNSSDYYNSALFATKQKLWDAVQRGKGALFDCGDFSALLHEMDITTGAGGSDPPIVCNEPIFPEIVPNPDLTSEPQVQEPSCCETGSYIEFADGPVIDPVCSINGENYANYLYEIITLIDPPCSPEDVTAGQPFNWGQYTKRTQVIKLLGGSSYLYSSISFYEAIAKYLECLSTLAQFNNAALSGTKSALEQAQKACGSKCNTYSERLSAFTDIEKAGSSSGGYYRDMVNKLEACAEKYEELYSQYDRTYGFELTASDGEYANYKEEVIETFDLEEARMEFNGKIFAKGAVKAIEKGTGKFLPSVIANSIAIAGDFITEFVSDYGNLKGTISFTSISGRNFATEINCKFCSQNKLTDYEPNFCDNIPCTEENCPPDTPTPTHPDCTNYGCPTDTPTPAKCTNDNCPPAGDGLNIVYRVISLTDPFPNNREASLPWDTSNSVSRIIENGRGYASGYEIYSLEPMYTITLTPADIRTIKSYNQEHKFNDFNMTCDNGLYCLSNYIHGIGDNEEEGKNIRKLIDDNQSCAMDELDWYNCYEGGKDGEYANYLEGFLDILRG